MSVLSIDHIQRILLSNNAKLLSLRKQPKASKCKESADAMIANLASINEQADAVGDTLLSVSSLLIQEVIDDIYTSTGVPEKELIDKAIIWHEQARRYIKQPKSEKVISSLISHLPEEFQEEMNGYLHDDTPDDTTLGNFDVGFSSDFCEPDPWGDDAEFGGMFDAGDIVEDKASDNIMQIVGHEFFTLLQFLKDLETAIASNKQAGVETVVESLNSFLETLRTACAEVKLDGLSILCDFIKRNTCGLPTMSEASQAACVDVLRCLPEHLSNHINEPESNDLLMALIDHLSVSQWPESIAYREEKALIYALIGQLSVLDQSNVSHQDEIEISADSVRNVISEDATPSLIDSFFVESTKHAEQLTTAIGLLAKGVDLENNILASQRLSHTLKGSANLLGVQGIANFAHYLEDIFEYLLKNQCEIPKDLSDCMQDVADTIEAMIESLFKGGEQPDDALSTLERIVTWINDISSLQEELAPQAVKPLSVPTFTRAVMGSEDSVEVSKQKEERLPEVGQAESVSDKHIVETEMLRVPRVLIDNLLNMVGETSISLGQMQEKLTSLSGYGKTIHRQDKTLQLKRFELEELINVQGVSGRQRLRDSSSSESNSEFDSLEMDEYDEFYGATNSYIETVSDARFLSKQVTQELDELETLFVQQKRLNKTLQDMVMSTRMVTVNSVSARLHRTVRQASRATHKEVELNIVGENLQVDSDLLNNLVDSLMHLLRNAVDHGIETQEVRFDKGKPSQGLIKLVFLQEGNHLKITCSDDGGGLDYSKIFEKAKAKGLVTNVALSNEAIARLILKSGFTTRDEVTQISGRGVGMDVVNDAVSSLRGNISIYESPDTKEGTVFEMRLPVTLLTNHSILVMCGEQQYAIPTNTLEQILSPGAGRLELFGNQLSFTSGHKSFPVVSFNTLLAVSEESLTSSDTNLDKPVLLINIDDQMHAIVVDGVVSAVDLVVKGFGPYVGSIPGVLGVSLLGNGEIISVIDLPQLLRNARSFEPHLVESSISQEVDDHKVDRVTVSNVLIVDDSLSARGSLAELARDAGHNPILARDGLEALNIINNDPPDLILTDLEMPRMNGLELAAQVRSGGGCSHIPIVMITSRTMQKHRDEAKSAGVNEYITKPFVPEDLMDVVTKSLQRAS